MESNPHIKLQQEIMSAFSRRSCVSAAMIVEDSGDYEEDMIREAFGGKRWQDVSLGTVEQHYASLPLFTEKGFLSYLPCFMNAAIIFMQNGKIDSPVISFTVYELAGDRFDANRQPEIVERAHGLNHMECSAVIKFLKLVIADSRLSQLHLDAESSIPIWQQLVPCK